MMTQPRISRRKLFGSGFGIAGLGSNLVALAASSQTVQASSLVSQQVNKINQPVMRALSGNSPTIPPFLAGLPFMNGDVDPNLNGFDPTALLTQFDSGNVSKLPNGQTQREYTLEVIDKTISIAPGQTFDAWTFNGQVPGPTIRVTEGDHIRINFTNKGTMPHGLHFHGIHAASADGAYSSVVPGGQTTYEFDAFPFGLHLYHCHMSPLPTHIYKGLYGMFIIDPPQSRPLAQELAMMLNAFALNVNPKDQKTNDIYAVNTVPYHFVKHPIAVPANKLVRAYVGGMLEFDRLFSFHLQGNTFNLFPTGTTLQPTSITDTLMMCQGQRAILEFSFPTAGQYMFRSAYSEHADKGFIGLFNVT